MLRVLAGLWVASGGVVVLAQAVSDNATTALATLVVQLGLSGVFLWLYLSERSQRQKRDDQIIELGSSLGPLAASMTATLDRFQESVASTMHRAAEIPGAADKLDIHDRRLELATDAMREVAELLREQAGRRHEEKP